MPSVFLYSDSPSPSLLTGGVMDFLSQFGLKVNFRGDFLSYLSLEPEELLEFDSLLAKARVFSIEKPVDFFEGPETNQPSEPFDREIYDGFWVQRLFSRFFLRKYPEKLSESAFHAIITGRLLATFDIKRYHARVIISGVPSLISTSGMVEGPARPREYYFLKAEFTRLGKDLSELDEFFRGRFVEYRDERITKIASAYVLQPLLHHFSGREFCADKRCSLFNSHWQKEVLDIQYAGGVCAECADEITKIGENRSPLS